MIIISNNADIRIIYIFKKWIRVMVFGIMIPQIIFIMFLIEIIMYWRKKKYIEINTKALEKELNS